VEEKPDFGNTTAVIVRAVRKRLTPATVWGAIGTLTIAIGYVLNAQHDISRLKETVAKLEQERKESTEGRDQDRELLHKIDTQLAVMGSKVDDIAAEVDRQREWRDRLSEIAESPPKARRRK
jgi:cell division protein ZapA (FtsZ GTPase activity inhibitor)